MYSRRGFSPYATIVPLVAIVLALGAVASAEQDSPRKRINVHVDSVVASDTHEGVDTRLAAMGQRLQSLFSYTTYRLVQHQDGKTECGKEVSFDLPGGRILHVQPRDVAGDMIAMEVILFQGERPVMSTDLKLRNHGVLIVGGPRYEQGMLIISIGAETIGGPHSAATTADIIR